MEPFTTVSGPVSALLRDDVDTDQIIPKQFLKRVERTGFGEFLFYDWAKEPGWDLPEQPDPRHRGELRLRLVARARAVGARGLRLPRVIAPSFADIFRSNCTKIGLLPVQLREPTRCVRWPRRARPRSTSPPRRSGPAGGRCRFEIDDDIKHRLLNGLDDIALTLQHAAAIDAYEARARAHRRAESPQSL